MTSRPGPAADDALPSEPGPAATTDGPAAGAVPGRRRSRRVVRPGAGEPDPSGALRSFDEADPRPRPDGADDARLLREVPPHW